MITCANCGYENPEGSRFCANCGASLLGTGRAGGSVPPAPVTDRSEIPPTSPEWRMSDPGPLPPPPRRPRWLWFLLGILGLCLLICVGLFVWANTIGRETVEGFITTIEAIQTATAVAGNPGGGSPISAGTPAGADAIVVISTPVAD